MIEKYFELGVRLKWTKPADVDPPVKDGAIVASTRPAGTITYDGLDVVVSPKLMMTHVSALGFTMRMPIQHQWLDYAKGKTARVKLGGQDVLTGFMSGCLIVKWQDPTGTHVGHLGTMDTNPAATRAVRAVFRASAPQTVTGFNPAAAWPLNDALEISGKFDPPRISAILALVTGSGEFYSILLLGMDSRVNINSNTEFCVGGIRKCTPLTRAELMTQLA